MDLPLYEEPSSRIRTSLTVFYFGFIGYGVAGIIISVILFLSTQNAIQEWCDNNSNVINRSHFVNATQCQTRLIHNSGGSKSVNDILESNMIGVIIVYVIIYGLIISLIRYAFTQYRNLDHERLLASNMIITWIGYIIMMGIVIHARNQIKHQDTISDVIHQADVIRYGIMSQPIYPATIPVLIGIILGLIELFRFLCWSPCQKETDFLFVASRSAYI